MFFNKILWENAGFYTDVIGINVEYLWVEAETVINEVAIETSFPCIPTIQESYRRGGSSPVWYSFGLVGWHLFEGLRRLIRVCAVCLAAYSRK